LAIINFRSHFFLKKYKEIYATYKINKNIYITIFYIAEIFLLTFLILIIESFLL
jgi:hypothetical protein